MQLTDYINSLYDLTEEIQEINESTQYNTNMIEDSFNYFNLYKILNTNLTTNKEYYKLKLYNKKDKIYNILKEDPYSNQNFLIIRDKYIMDDLNSLIRIGKRNFRKFNKILNTTKDNKILIDNYCFNNSTKNLLLTYICFDIVAIPGVNINIINDAIVNCIKYVILLSISNKNYDVNNIFKIIYDLVNEILPNPHENEQILDNLIEPIKNYSTKKITGASKKSDDKIYTENLSERLKNYYNVKGENKTYYKDKDLHKPLDLFIETIIIKSNYDNNDEILFEKEYDFNMNIFNLCNNLNIWILANKNNIKIIERLVLTYQFMKLKLIKPNLNKIILKNTIFKLLNQVNIDIENLNNKSYYLFNEIITEQMKNFRYKPTSEGNFPDESKYLLETLLILWDQTIYELLFDIENNEDPEPIKNIKKNIIKVSKIKKSKVNTKNINIFNIPNKLIKKNIRDKEILVDSSSKYLLWNMIENYKEIMKDLKEDDLNNLIKFKNFFDKEKKRNNLKTILDLSYNFIKIIAIPLDIKNPITPTINNITDNLSLKLFITSTAHIIDRYLGKDLIKKLENFIFIKEYNELNKSKKISQENDIKDTKYIKEKLQEVIDYINPYSMYSKLDSSKKESINNNIRDFKTFSQQLIIIYLNSNKEKLVKQNFETVEELFDDLKNKVQQSILIDLDDSPNFLTYYKDLYENFIKRSFSVIINYNRFIINLYKKFSTINSLIQEENK